MGSISVMGGVSEALTAFSAYDHALFFCTGLLTQLTIRTANLALENFNQGNRSEGLRLAVHTVKGIGLMSYCIYLSAVRLYEVSDQLFGFSGGQKSLRLAS